MQEFFPHVHHIGNDEIRIEKVDDVIFIHLNGVQVNPPVKLQPKTLQGQTPNAVPDVLLPGMSFSPDPPRVRCPMTRSQYDAMANDLLAQYWLAFKPICQAIERQPVTPEMKLLAAKITALCVHLPDLEDDASMPGWET